MIVETKRPESPNRALARLFSLKTTKMVGTRHTGPKTRGSILVSLVVNGAACHGPIVPRRP
jgi:hypothetical protein